MKRKYHMKHCFLFAGALLFSGTLTAAPQAAQTFPLLFGMNIGAKNYDNVNYQTQLAKLDAAVLGFYKGWKGDKNGEKISAVLQHIKAINPNILLGQYTILNETYNNSKDAATIDKRNKVLKENWWLRDKAGKMQQWSTQFGAWDINMTDYSKPDAAGIRYPEWVANRDYSVFFKNIPEFDIWFFDNVFFRPRVAQADWTASGVNQSQNDPVIQQKYREAHVAEWQAANSLAPGLLQMGNVDNDLSSTEFKGKLEGAFLEAMMGQRWSLDTWKGWDGMMDHYHKVINNTAEPHMVVFNVHGTPTDYQFFRLSFTSCLLDNGYYSYTDKAKGYSSVPWFDEYDVNLGAPIDAPQYKPNNNGVYLRRFQYGMVLVNPTTVGKKIAVPAGYSFFKGKQAKKINNGAVARTVVLGPRDGVVLVKK